MELSNGVLKVSLVEYPLINNLIINQNLVIKGKRKNRTFLDILFTNGMTIIVNVIFNTRIRDINAQPKMFNRSLIKKILKLGPSDFSLDLFLLLLASKNNLIINEFPLKVKNRVNDRAKGGGSFFGKIKLTIATLKFICLFKFNLNHKLWKL